jgi:hypothetical protein
MVSHRSCGVGAERMARVTHKFAPKGIRTRHKRTSSTMRNYLIHIQGFETSTVNATESRV